MDSFGANRSLETFYAPKLEAWKELYVQQRKVGRKLSIPMFLEVFPEYLAARPRIVFVGQETNGWWKEYDRDPLDLSVGQIMDFYGTMWGWLYEEYRQSPYWQAMRHVAGALQQGDPSMSFTFANLFPCDVDKKKAPEPILEIMRSWKILPYELEILAPDYVIFFCGPVYSYNLGSYFGHAVDPSSFSLQNPWQRYDLPGKKWKGFLTYHPAFLRRSEKGNVLDEIIQAIQSDLNF